MQDQRARLEVQEEVLGPPRETYDLLARDGVRQIDRPAQTRITNRDRQYALAQDRGRYAPQVVSTSGSSGMQAPGRPVRGRRDYLILASL